MAVKLRGNRVIFGYSIEFYTVLINYEYLITVLPFHSATVNYTYKCAMPQSGPY